MLNVTPSRRRTTCWKWLSRSWSPSGTNSLRTSSGPGFLLTGRSDTCGPNYQDRHPRAIGFRTWAS